MGLDLGRDPVELANRAKYNPPAMRGRDVAVLSDTMRY